MVQGRTFAAVRNLGSPTTPEVVAFVKRDPVLVVRALEKMERAGKIAKVGNTWQSRRGRAKDGLGRYAGMKQRTLSDATQA